MKIKKFKARNFAEALELVKKELSEDAIILSTEEKKGVRPFVEVTAAVDYDNEKFKVRNSENTTGALTVNEVERSEVRGQRSEIENKIFEAHDSRLTTHNSSIEEIKSEIEILRETIEIMRNNGYEISLPPNKRMILSFLRERSVQEEFALSLCGKANDLNDIPPLISADIKVKESSISNEGGKKAVMLIGPTGVGKTTTIAKLSALAIKDSKRVGIINLDSYRIGALEQMRIYSRIMGIPLSIVSNTNELRNGFSKFAENRDIIFIDTTGRNPNDEAYINYIIEICKTEIPLEIHLLMSANCDNEFMMKACKFYTKLPIDYVVLTKVDEAVRFGSLYNLLLTYRKPVAYITTGQNVPGDIEFVTVDKLVNLILEKGSYKC